MLSDAKSFLWRSITTFLGGLPGIGLYGSITCIFQSLVQTYLRVDVGHTGPLFAVEAQVNFGVSKEFFANERFVIGSALIGGRCLLLDFEEEVFLFQT